MKTNDDMICRSAAKTEIRKLMLEVADTPLVDEYTAKLATKLGELVMKKLDELPKMLAYEWMDAKADPPEEFENVLIFIRGEERAVPAMRSSIGDKYLLDDDSYVDGSLITHWMPIPERLDCGSRLKVDDPKGVREEDDSA